MNKQDWMDYTNYLKSQVNMAELLKPKSIREAYNNSIIMKDLEDVVTNKIGISKNVKGQY